MHAITNHTSGTMNTSSRRSISFVRSFVQRNKQQVYVGIIHQHMTSLRFTDPFQKDEFLGGPSKRQTHIVTVDI
jgi:hypothetical protein